MNPNLYYKVVKEFCKKVEGKTGCVVDVAPIKSLSRVMEKVLFDFDKPGACGKVSLNKKPEPEGEP